MTTRHVQVTLHRLVSDGCPHGPEPALDTTAWDDWMDLGHEVTGSGIVCLSVPVGSGCATCSADAGKPVLWDQCIERVWRRSCDEITGMVSVHHTIPVWEGPQECLNRECGEYFDDDGAEIISLVTCSHISRSTACSCQQISDVEFSDQPCTHTPDGAS